jgi:hypothetical protein
MSGECKGMPGKAMYRWEVDPHLGETLNNLHNSGLGATKGPSKESTRRGRLLECAHRNEVPSVSWVAKIILVPKMS